MHDVKLITTNYKNLISWGAGLLLLASFIVVLFVPIHPAIPPASDLVMTYSDARLKWETRLPKRYILEIHQDDSYLATNLTVIVMGEKVEKVISAEPALRTSPPSPRKLIKTEEATVSHLFQLAQTNINSYKSPQYQVCPRNFISMPIIAYDSKLGYPTTLKYQSIQVDSNFDRLLGGATCHPMAVPKKEDAFSAKITPLNQ